MKPMLGRSNTTPRRSSTRFALLAALAGATVAVAAAPTVVDAAPKNAKRCWPGDRYGHNADVPDGVKNPERYANCGDCEPIPSGSVGKCELWFGAQTAHGGPGGLSHKGWPGLTGIRWQVTSDGNRGAKVTGSRFNDGLYGRHGSDRLYGGAGNDILWGDSKISKRNDGRQHDILDGGPGNDWIYASHGRNTIRGGTGNDRIFAYYGRGTIDCGPGKDTVTVLKKSKYKLKNCEIVKHPGN